jgi:phosphatidylinositol alpha-1,6-mannosyltransferase
MNNILIISSEFPPGPGGIGKHSLDLSRALANKGFIITVLAHMDYTNDIASNNFINELPPNIKVQKFARTRFFTIPLRILRIYKVVISNRFKSIILTGSFPIFSILLIKFLLGERQHVDIFVHGSEINPKSQLIRRLTHFCLSKADIIWSVSNFTNLLIPNRVLVNSRNYILPNGIHFLDWAPFTNVEPFNTWPGYPKLLTVGNISRRKGQHRVIQALPQLIKTYPNIHYHIVGLDTNSDEIKAYISKNELADYVTIHGKFPSKYELAKAYKSADIFVMLSENQKDGDVEGFGIAILEANFFSRPALGAKGCGIEDAIDIGINGELVDGDNPMAILDCVDQIMINVKRNSYDFNKKLNELNWDELVKVYIKEAHLA